MIQAWLFSLPLCAEARGEDDHKLVIVEGTVLGEGAFSRVVKVRSGRVDVLGVWD
jgi:hypothetical protein